MFSGGIIWETNVFEAGYISDDWKILMVLLEINI